MARKQFGIVGIGASAGGLEALQRLFANIPAATGYAYVVVQHLSPDHKSLMAELLAKYTAMPVRQIEDGDRPKADVIYLLPPGKTVIMSGGCFSLSEKQAGATALLPIDRFLEALAHDQRERAVAVILSGTGSDGSRGAIAVRQVGGMVIAQDPGTAKFDGMPRSAIATGAVDEISAPEVIGETLGSLRRTQRRPTRRDKDPVTEGDAMDAILESLRSHSDVDFTHYKRSTLTRRIDRRLHACNLADLKAYAHYLKATNGEVALLYKELLIGVTKFFRDTEAFAILRTQVIPDIVNRHPQGEPVRVWVCGCATGEEAYSLAILFAEHMRQSGSQFDVKIFATDVDRESVDFGSMGVYPADSMTAVPEDLVERYFIRRGDSFAVSRIIRQMVVFARHNVIKDPPFTRVDMITCRNLLIYLQSNLQRRVLSRFHYALRSAGYLFLGSSESLGELSKDFAAVSSKEKIFQAMSGEKALPPDLLSLSVTMPSAPMPLMDRRGRRDSQTAIDLGLTLLIEDFSPPAILVDEHNQIQHVFGTASRFLQVPSGAATLDLFRMLPSRLSTVVSSTVHSALRKRREARSHAVTLEGGDASVSVRVRPFADREGTVYSLIVFETTGILADGDMAVVDVGAETAERIRSLEDDLQASREHLQATIEELETANEELQATNEELLASNEELQSTNEELQSVNEELYTVNSEYEVKIQELTHITNDLDNLFRATDIATLFLDRELIIRRFTPAATPLVNVMPRDVGRSIAHIATNLSYPRFLEDIRTVLDNGAGVSREVRTEDGRWMLARLLPYTIEVGPQDAHCVGVVVTFVDVTAVKEAQRRLQGVLDCMPEAVAVVEKTGEIKVVNAAWRRLMGQAAEDAGGPYLEVCRTAWRLEQEGALRLQEAISRLAAGEQGDLTLDLPKGGPAGGRILVTGRRIEEMDGNLVISHLDLADRDRSPELADTP